MSDIRDHTQECYAAMYRGPHVCICGAALPAAAPAEGEKQLWRRHGRYGKFDHEPDTADVAYECEELGEGCNLHKPGQFAAAPAEGESASAGNRSGLREALALLRKINDDALLFADQPRERTEERYAERVAMSDAIDRLFAALPAAAPAEGLPWRYYYDTYEKGTVFIATDPDTIIADDLPYEKGKALVDAHNAALARHESAGSE